MIKKAATDLGRKREAADEADLIAKAKAQNKPEETWNHSWNVSRRLLEMRRRLRGTKLWATFEIQRSFEAFSIHALANGIEEVAGDCGLISSFRVTQWSKEGNRTVVEGMITFEDVDTGEVREYPGVGEAIDDSDKGIHKADSDARKVALINALNLGIGSDKEAANEKHDERPAEPKMGGKPQQAKPSTNDLDGIKTNGHVTAKPAAKTYTLQQTGLKACGVLGSQLVERCWNIIFNAPTNESIDTWERMNEEMLIQFTQDDPDNAHKLKQIVDSRRETLRGKGL